MKDKKVFSPEQERAINTRDRTLLVSAAAGSGKTTTLTERIIRSLLDEKAPESIQNMLIVTFTNASVFDLKEKISAALTEASLEHPEDKRLEEELRSLDYAKIMTIDSFCAEAVRINAERLGITPLYRIAETAEALILERSVIESLIDRAYRGELSDSVDPEKFEKLCDALTGVKNTSSLADVLISLYEKTKSLVKETEIFFDFANDYLQFSEKPIEETRYVRYIMEEVRETLLYFPSLLSHYTGPLVKSEDSSLLLLSDDLTEIAGRLSALAREELTYDELRERIFAFEFPKAPTVKNPKPPEALRAIDYRLEIKSAISKLKTELLSYTSEEWRELYRDMSEYVSVLASFLSLFSRVYFEEKRRRGCFEFSDVERLAYNVLYRDGELTDVAKEYRELFTSVYIDEYQDVNELQNKIFEAVSPAGKKFMVGDIKQSIYGFRSAKPEIFSDMKKRFPPLSDEYTAEASIFMSNNYRCDKGIVDFVNEVFDGLFGAVAESIGYVDEDKLIFKKKTDGEPIYERANICLIERKEKSTEENDGADNDDELAAAEAEAAFAAAKIEELLKTGKKRDGSPILPSDIAIIMKTKKSFSVYESALEKRGILSTAAEDKDFFMNKEILLTLSLLSAIDNPRKDVHLAALMCSPLYGFTPDEIYIFKSEGDGHTLYDSLLNYQKCNPEFTKLNVFIKDLLHYRALCEGMNVDVLLTRLYQETGLLSLASRQGGKENLYKLYSYARRFEGSAYKGLYNFITYVNTLITRGAKIDKTESLSKEENAVTIGTIHSSKGLEFPVVFLANASAPLVNLDLREKIAFSEDFGISFLLRGPGGLALVENPLSRVIFSYMNKKFCEEAIRLLYVALTRAKEKLYVVGELKKNTDAEEYLEKVRAHASTLSAYTVRRLSSYMDMICATVTGSLESIDFSDSESDSHLRVIVTDTAIVTAADSDDSRVSLEKAADSQESAADTQYSEKVAEKLTERFNFIYPNEHLTLLPEKMSVSRLYPTVLDGTESDGEDVVKEEKERAEPAPRFISRDPIDESARRGIATHNFLQFFDLEALKRTGVDAELERLKEKGFLSEKTASLVRRDELKLFKNSELFSAMQNAKALYREFRFNTRLPAEYFTSDKEKAELYKGETILVQGVIDCLIENGDGSYRLIDYKTDRLTKEELEDEELAREKLKEKHSLQLSYYALAVEKIFGRLPCKVEVYSLPLGKTVSVKD